MAVNLKKSQAKKVAEKKEINHKWFNESNPNSRKVVVKEFSYRMTKGLYNALAADSQSKNIIPGAWKQRSRFDGTVLAALNQMSLYTRKITSIIID